MKNHFVYSFEASEREKNAFCRISDSYTTRANRSIARLYLVLKISCASKMTAVKFNVLHTAIVEKNLL